MKVNKVEQFLNDVFGEVRVLRDGVHLYFVAQDVAKVLEYASTQKVTEKVDDEDILRMKKSELTNFVDSKSGNMGGSDIALINEGGLYQVIASVTKRDMKRYSLSRDFKRWITGEVIPTIRETGGYVETNREQEFIDNYFSDMSDDLKADMMKSMMKTNKRLQVKSGKFDKFLDSESTYSFTEVAKMISTQATEESGEKVEISNMRLTRFLRDEGIINKSRKGSGYSNLPNKGYEEYFDVVSRSIGISKNVAQTRVKPLGVEFVYEKLMESNQLQ